MGGQACVFYGAAEFSRDTDLAILANSENLTKLKNALEDLQATEIAVPPFEAKYLRKGHAIHFRCHHPEAAGMRIDVMTKMRGVDSFLKLWGRRTTLSIDDGTIELMSLPDLVQAQGPVPAHLLRKRPLLELAVTGSQSSLADTLLLEEQREREADRQYWAPLKKELERLRHSRASQAER